MQINLSQIGGCFIMHLSTLMLLCCNSMLLLDHIEGAPKCSLPRGWIACFYNKKVNLFNQIAAYNPSRRLNQAINQNK